MADGDMGVGERDVQEKTEATMKRGRIMTRAVLLLIVIGLSLSACAVQPGGYVYDGYPYYPVYGSFDFDYGGWGGWHHGWDHGHWDHGDWHHGFAHGGWGHGFAHGGFGGHGGWGYR